jgi:YHS domain-containing protein
MKYLTLPALLACCLLTAAAALAADAPKKSEDKNPKPVNAICPVSDHDVEPGVTATHNKKVIGFCCEDCVESFNKNPAKFIKKIEAEEAKNKKAAKGEKSNEKPQEKSKGEQPAADKTKPVNKFCPIDRENAVDPTATAEYNGKLIGFCCEDCIKKFDLDPDAYLANLK